MKTKILCLFLLIFSSALAAQDAKKILTKSYKRCQSIKNGYYEMKRQRVNMMSQDTSFNLVKCSFSRLKNDTIYPATFYYTNHVDGQLQSNILYTGSEFVSAYSYDSSATLMSTALWATDIKAYKHNFFFFAPLFSGELSPLAEPKTFDQPQYQFKYIGEEVINGQQCHHIYVSEKADNQSLEMISLLNIEFDYWVNKADFIPIQYAINYQILIGGNDTVYQHEMCKLQKYELNKLKDKKILTTAALPDFYRITDYAPQSDAAAYKPLPVGTAAPDWTLKDFSGKEINLKDLQGELVLIDFFYKACYPCMLALPDLQALHEKYKDKGLHVIGIDPKDEPNSDIQAFLAKRGVTYSVLLAANAISEAYSVFAYPTIFLIDKTGKIIFVQSGYSKELHKELEALIEKNL